MKVYRNWVEAKDWLWFIFLACLFIEGLNFLFGKFYLFIFGCAGSLRQLVPSCSEQGLLSSCSVQASHCGGFSCCRASQVAQMVKKLSANAGDLASIPGSGRSPGEGNSNPPLYYCLENAMDREAWWATVHGVTQTDMTEQLRLSLVA